MLVGAALRINLLTDSRFHPDEALFAALGRLIVSGQDPLLQHTSLLVDKPPLFYLLLASGISINWGAELSARLPGLFASIVSLALASRVAARLWHSDYSAILAAALIALSPFAIQFSPTVFADPIMVMWVLAALAAVTGGRWVWAGILVGCAAATKQSGLIFLPLVAAQGLIQQADPRQRPMDVLRCLGKWAAGLGVMLTLVAIWVAVRAAPVTFWQAGIAANDPGRFVRVAEVGSRLLGWANWLGHITASFWLNIVLAVWIVGATLWLIMRRSAQRSTAHSVTLLAFLVAYLGMIWLVAFPLLDRYLLPVVVLCLMAAGGLAGEALRATGRRRIAIATSALLALAMIPQAVRAAQGAYPIGGDHGQYDGIEEIAAVLGDLPEGSVVYYSTLGWPLTYYLFDSPVYLASVDSGEALADDLKAFARDDPETVRVLVVPGWESQEELLGPTLRAGFVAEPLRVIANRRGLPSFIVYRIRLAQD